MASQNPDSSSIQQASMTSGLEIVEDSKSILGALIASYVHPHHFLLPIKAGAYGDVYGLLHHLFLFLHIIVDDNIKEHDNVLALKRPRLLGYCLRKHPVSYPADHLSQCLYAIDILQMCGDDPCAYPLRIHRAALFSIFNTSLWCFFTICDSNVLL